ncbi:MAG: replication-associated recombination protein A [Alphaproteobacteria bacterium]|nr:replication-associated recombination protein A [Alphaproteobacteria bacterium]
MSNPLADLIRPESLSDLIGQEHLFGERGILSLILESKKIPSLILCGPPGVGKTTIAKALARISDAEFVLLSAINSGVADVRKIISKSPEHRAPGTGHRILMIDEIHHFNKTQQDLFLPAIESGTITLIGTTTENPSFHLNSALLSRCKVVTLKSLDEVALEKIMQRAEKIVGKELPLTKDGREALISLACGDARYLLNICEIIFDQPLLDSESLQKLISKRAAHFDKKGDFHYNLISAFHKSLRGSDVDAALYYLARMLTAKEDPYYILRRLMRFASEDVGLADPNALTQVAVAKDAYDFLGSPEGELAITQAVIYCATAPKSNAAYLAHKAMLDSASRSSHLLPPENILSAPSGYIYDHDTPNCFSGQDFFPREMSHQKFYEPNERGFEREVKKRLEYWSGLKGKITAA